MAKLTLTQAQRLLLGIVTSVETGASTPEEAVAELNKLKQDAADAGLTFKANYTLEDFQKIRQDYVSQYETSSDPYESSYVESTSSY